MSDIWFLDTNILVRHLVHDIPDQSARASRLIRAVAAGGVSIRLPDTVVFETVFTLQRVYAVPKQEICLELADVIELPGVILDHKEAVLQALRFWSGIGGLSFADCYHLALAADLRFKEIYSFDKQMDRYPGLERIEP